ncbi:MAG: hypothetical protein ACFFBL_02385 [Promethearchaeota archaeon]
MTHFNTKLVLGLAVSLIFLFGTMAAPVSALQTNIKIETNNQGFRSDAYNHTYVYAEPNPLNMVSRGTMHTNESLDYTANRFNGGGWTQGFGSFPADSNYPFNWMSFNGWGTGQYDNPTILPAFYDFEASDGSEHVVNTTLETRTFSLTFGQHTPVQVDAGYTCFGTLGVSGQEFVHLTIDSRQDSVSWSITVIDPEGRFMNSYSGSNGDIWTIPFKPSVGGTYYIILQASPSIGTFALFDLFPVAVTPQSIAPGGIVTGTLPTGELVIDDETGSFVYKEMPPTVHTYKVNSPNDVASITYAFNYPPGFIGPPQPVSIYFTSGDFEYGYNGGTRYSDGVGSPTSGEYFFRGGPYYATITGGDNTEYTLYHKAGGNGVLPTNHEFQIENYMGAIVTHAYTLNVEEPSMLRVNSTASGADLDIRMTGLYDDGYRVDRTISFASTLAPSSEYYLPAGEYFFEMDIDNGVNEWIEFNLGPIVDTTSAGFDDVGGFFVDTTFNHLYNMTLILTNPDNITVGVEVSIYDTSGNLFYTSSTSLANWWDGFQIVPHSSIWNNDTFNYMGQQWYDGPAIVGICAYNVANNTLGPPSNYYGGYTVNLTIQWTDRTNDLYMEIGQNVDVSSTAFYNFTSPAPGRPLEAYGLMLNTTPGTWYNVSIRSGTDATDFSAEVFSVYDGRTHWIGWSDLDDYQVGSTSPPSDLGFQFGAISEQSFLHLQISRDQLVDGYLWVKITPMETHPLVVGEVTPLGPDILAILGGLAIPIAVGVGVIVVVYIVYVKRFKK